jgi:hypothetical protein
LFVAIGGVATVALFLTVGRSLNAGGSGATVQVTASLSGPYPVSGSVSQRVGYNSCDEWFTNSSGLQVTIDGQSVGVANQLRGPGTDTNNDLELAIGDDPERGQFAGPSSETVNPDYSGTYTFSGNYKNAANAVESGTISWTCAP